MKIAIYLKLEKALNIENNNDPSNLVINKHNPIIDSEAGITSSINIIFLLMFYKLKINPSLIKFIENYNPKFIVFNSTHHCWMVPLLKKTFKKTEIIVIVREQIKKYRSLAGRLNYQWLKNADKLICISEFEKDLLSNKYKYVIHNTIGKNYIFKDKILFKNNNNIIKLIQMGQPAFSKGGHILIIALALYKNNYRQEKIKFETKLIGAGSKGLFKKDYFSFLIKTIFLKNTRYFYEFLINILKLNNEVKLTDYLMDIQPLLENSDIYIRTSLSGDGWGRDIIEAMSSGLLCISSGKSPFIEDEISGFLYDSNNPNSLKKLLDKISNMPKYKLQFIAKNGQQKIKRMCSYETFNRSLNDCFFNNK